MKTGLNDEGYPSTLRLHVIKKTEPRFCIFPKVKSVEDSPGIVPVYLNVYDLTPANGYMYWAGLGVFHTGVEVYGIEYAFGAHDCPTSGIFEVEPRQCPGFKFRKSILMGTTNLDPFQIREFMEYQSANYHGDTYHLIIKNCNHFCGDICSKLTGNPIPKWVNRLARMGSACSCILPDAFKTPKIQHDPNLLPDTLKSSKTQNDPNLERSDSEKKSKRSSLRCFSSKSKSQKFQRRESKAPLIPASQDKGFLRRWKSCKSSERER